MADLNSKIWFSSRSIYKMKSRPVGLSIISFILVAAILAGCSFNLAPAAPTTAPSSTPQATSEQEVDVNQVRTQAAETVIADLTKNAPTATPVTPTDTATPQATITITLTNTPVPPTARPTATWIPWTKTPVYTATLAAYNCTITDYSPKSSENIKVSTDFDGRWVVKNTGTQTWVKTEVDIKYISGTKFQTKVDIFDLKSDVVKGDSYTVIVDMKTPADAGSYNTTWAIVQGGLTICSLNLTVTVVK
jgi:cytoskeletal protein RodZ